MTNPFFDGRAAVLEAIRRGVRQEDRLNGPTEIGPTQFSAIDYPYAQVLPESTDQQDGNDYVHTVRVNSMFQRDRGVSYIDQLEAALDAVMLALDELRGVECVYNFTVTTIEDFVGERNDTALLMISVQLGIGTFIDQSNV